MLHRDISKVKRLYVNDIVITKDGQQYTVVLASSITCVGCSVFYETIESNELCRWCKKHPTASFKFVKKEV